MTKNEELKFPSVGLDLWRDISQPKLKLILLNINIVQLYNTMKIKQLYNTTHLNLGTLSNTSPLKGRSRRLQKLGHDKKWGIEI